MGISLANLLQQDLLYNYLVNTKMPLYPDNRVSHNCDTIDFNRITCPQYLCKYCYGPNHPVVKCLTARPYENCDSKGPLKPKMQRGFVGRTWDSLDCGGLAVNYNFSVIVSIQGDFRLARLKAKTKSVSKTGKYLT